MISYAYNETVLIRGDALLSESLLKRFPIQEQGLCLNEPRSR